jgi:hypothetical protein
MNPARKKFISLFLISSLMMGSVTLYAKERRGAKVLITKRDGKLFEGELITVKPTSLLLLTKEGKDQSVDIADIKVIRVINKSKILSGAGPGLLIGGGTGALIGFLSGDDSGYVGLSAADKALVLGIGLGTIGLLIGGVGGAFAGADKTFLIEGKHPVVIKSALNYLRKKARVRDNE